MMILLTMLAALAEPHHVSQKVCAEAKPAVHFEQNGKYVDMIVKNNSVYDVDVAYLDFYAFEAPSSVQIRVKDLRGKPYRIRGQYRGGWWSPSLMRESEESLGSIPVKTIRPGKEFVTSVDPKVMLQYADLDRLLKGKCEFQIRMDTRYFYVKAQQSSSFGCVIGKISPWYKTSCRSLMH